MSTRRAVTAVLATLGISALASIYYYSDLANHYSTAWDHTRPTADREAKFSTPSTETASSDLGFRLAENRHLTTLECHRAYPELYLEADRAQAWYTKRGGITEGMVDAAEQDGGDARLAIIDNKVGTAKWLILATRRTDCKYQPSAQL